MEIHNVQCDKCKSVGPLIRSKQMHPVYFLPEGWHHVIKESRSRTWDSQKSMCNLCFEDCFGVDDED